MPETDGGAITIYMTRGECALMHRNIESKLDSIGEHVKDNRDDLDKIMKILTGNGNEGLILELKKLTWRSQMIDKVSMIVMGILSSIVTLVIVKVVGL